MTTISGAMTNIIYKVELKARVVAEGRQVTNIGHREGKASQTVGQSNLSAPAVLLRLYGDGTDVFFNRDEEVQILKKSAT